ncbi:MAG: hypothetical protein JO359_09720 [Candidatus Eremiobacteraeota bacterium]|nr:hypothetical protein [Candidatus Eremiobacteraeota bacterium]
MLPSSRGANELLAVPLSFSYIVEGDANPQPQAEERHAERRPEVVHYASIRFHATTATTQETAKMQYAMTVCTV